MGRQTEKFLENISIVNSKNFMAHFKAIFSLLVFVFASAKAECPRHGLEDIPDMYNDQTFNCARFYYGWGHDLSVRGCNGCSIDDYADIPHGMDLDAGDGHHYPMGSVMVKPGCTFYVYHETNFNGGYEKYEGPTIISRVDSGHNSQEDGCAKGWPSFQCRCGMTPVSCVPKDDFHVVLRCDGTGAILPTPCGYTKKIGTTFGDELSETISISSTIEYETTLSLFEIFEASLGFSMTTGYDWGHSSSVTKSVTEQFQVNALAPAGRILTIEQAIGTCGDTEVKTELFRIRHTDSKGNILYEELKYDQ